MCFAKDIMFSILLEEGSTGKTENGLYIGMKMADAEKIDSTIEYNDDDEDFISSMGYWINDSIETGLICAITIFISEAKDSTTFFNYEWVEKYKKITNKENGAGFTDSVFSFKNSVLSLTENKLQNILRLCLGAVEE